MIARRVLLSGAALLLAGPAVAQTATTIMTSTPQLPTAAAPPRPRPRRAVQPAPPEPPAAPARGEPAPVPNRDMEAPRQVTAQRTTPQLNPALIDPDSPQTGTARDGASLQAREERLLRQPAAGARLRLPFGY